MLDRDLSAFCEAPQWFAVQVAPKHEKKVTIILGHKSCVHFLPVYRSKRKWSDRVKNVELPLFPGYVFCQITRLLARHVLATPGVYRIVGFGGKPYPLSDEEMERLQRVTSSGRDLQPGGAFVIGERVRVVEGALAGVCGTLSHINNQQRLVIRVDLIQQSASVEVDISTVIPIRQCCTTTSTESRTRAGEPQEQIVS
jgi:transcription antitermination factor NusG